MSQTQHSKVIVDVNSLPRDRRFKNWTKTVTAVDNSKQNGFAFEGEFVKDLVELPVGTYLLHYHEEGSAKHHDPFAELYRVTADGMELVENYGELPMHWALAIRDQVAAQVTAEQPLDRAALEAEADALRARLAEIEQLLAE